MNLRTLKDNDVKEFTLDGQRFVGKVVDIYDGDTCKVIFEMDGKVCKFACRLDGIDTPEIRPSRSLADRDTMIALAKKARNRLIQLATNCQCNLDDIKLKKREIKELLNKNEKLVEISCHKFEKYGRVLISLYDVDKSDKSFNQILVDEDLAKSYDGGKKAEWTSPTATKE